MRKKILFFVILLIISLTFLSTQFNTYSSAQSHLRNKGTASVELQQIKDIQLTGGVNRLAAQSFDYSTNMLYISHLGSNLVHVFDLGKQKIIVDIPLSANTYGILAVPDLRKVYVSVGGSNTVAVIDENTLKVIKYIQAGKTPYGLAFYPQSENFYVSNENDGTVSVINARTERKITDIPVGGRLGDIHNFDRQDRIYAVLTSDNKFIEIDPTVNKVVGKYNLQRCSHPNRFYIDPVTHYAFITCVVNNMMLVFDLDSKKVIFSYTVGTGPDVIAYDEGLHYLYVASESGVITIFSVEKGNVRKISEEFIAPHAHTIAVDQSTHFVYLPLENIKGRPVLRILKPVSK